jgi:hypothetical protein
LSALSKTALPIGVCESRTQTIDEAAAAATEDDIAAEHAAAKTTAVANLRAQTIKHSSDINRKYGAGVCNVFAGSDRAARGGHLTY